MAGDPTLGRTHWRLLETLQADGRSPSADAARVVAMPPSAVAERIRLLAEDRRRPMAD
jgi:Lrp/AsnC family leucine-responsive transcriptional regulator